MALMYLLKRRLRSNMREFDCCGFLPLLEKKIKDLFVSFWSVEKNKQTPVHKPASLLQLHWCAFSLQYEIELLKEEEEEEEEESLLVLQLHF